VSSEKYLFPIAHPACYTAPVGGNFIALTNHVSLSGSRPDYPIELPEFAVGLHRNGFSSQSRDDGAKPQSLYAEQRILTKK